MSEYVLLKISDSSVQRFTDSDRERQDFPPDISQKDLRWHLVIRPQRPSVNKDTHILEMSNGLVGSNYIFDWTIRPKTQDELDKDTANKEANKSSVVENMMETLIGKLLFEQENRLRVLEGKSILNGVNYKNLIRSKV